MKPPRVSVVLPTRDRRERLRRALAGVAAQTFRDFDLWIVDDASVDGTADELGGDRLGASFPRLAEAHVLRNEVPAGAAAARNRALEQCAGELIAFLDDDDCWTPEYLERQVAHLDRHPEAAASHARHIEVDQSGRSRHPDLRPLFHYDDPLLHLVTESPIHTLSAVVCRRETVTRAGLLDPQLAIVHDLDWYARILLRGGSLSPLPGPPLLTRRLPGGLIGDHHRWLAEEQSLITRLVGQSPLCAARERQIRAHRNLFFARIGLARGDLGFAVRRLSAALLQAPARTLQIAVRRLSRNLRPRIGVVPSETMR
jgi:glycosyltransferase involved in cell wall biosynthesis